MIIRKILQTFEDDRRKLYEFLIGLAMLVLMSLLVSLHTFDSFENLFLDLRFQLRGPKAFDANITVVGVDEASLDVFGRWPWPRDHHAKLLDFLSRKSVQPKSIFFDMLFEEKDGGDPKGDENLVYRAQKFKNTVLMSYFFEKNPDQAYNDRYERHPEKEKRLEDFALPESKDIPENLESYDKVSLPFLELAEKSALAFVNTPADQDGRTRRSQLLAKYKGKIYPSADLLIALDYWGATVRDVEVEKRSLKIKTSQGLRRIPMNSRGELLINYYGSSEHLPSLSFLSILDAGKLWMKGADTELLRTLKDKLVLVGVTALGIGDRRTTPYHRYEPGVNLHAQVIANILQQKFLVKVSPLISFLTLWSFGLLVVGVTMFFKITRSLLLVIFMTLVYFGLTQMAFLKGQWVDFAAPGASAAVLFIAITSFRYFTALEELKRTQAQLIQTAKMASLGELSAGIAHEFRNILNAVNLNVECVTRPNQTPEKLAKYSDMLKKIMRSSNLILEGLLLFSRQSESLKTLGNLKEAMQDVLLIAEKEMMRHQIDLTVELDDVPEIPFDRGQISQVIMNMLNNSRDALKEKEREDKKITLGLKDAGSSVRIDIVDNGSGIPPQVLKRLFQPFVTSKPAGKGTGLGLSVCHGIIKNHGGEIKVETEQNKGTTWHIFLPKQ